MTKKNIFCFFVFLLITNILILNTKISSQVDQTYQKPPKEILELVDIKMPPTTLVDRDAKYLILADRPTFKSLEELADTELRLAGLRFSPKYFNSSRGSYFTGLSIQRIEDGKVISVKGLPSNLRMENPSLSPKQNYFSFVNVTLGSMDFWIVELKTGIAKKVSSSKLSSIMGMPYRWSEDEKFVYASVRNTSKPTFKENELPKGPAIQEATGAKASARTYQDLLKNKNDEDKFEYYVTTSIVKIYLDGKEKPFLPAKIYKAFEASPDGNFILVEEINKPFSYQLPLSLFPYKSYVIDKNGKLVKELVSKPLQDKIPINFNAVEEGKRDFGWRADKASTIYWAEAQDGGDPTKEAEVRDKIFQIDAPFNGEGKLVAATKNRFAGIVWGNSSYAIINETWWKNRNRKVYLINPEDVNVAPKFIYDGSSEDIYADPGRAVTAPNKFDEYTILFSSDNSKIYLQGEGYSPQGNKPFIDEYDIKTASKKRLWQADGISTYESIARVLNIEKGIILTRIEGQKIYPNLFMRNILSNEKPKQITFVENPYKTFEGVSKQKINYKREDGVDLSATLYLPEGYNKSKGRLPMLMEAYPTEFKDPKTAGQIRESPHRFVSLNYGSPVFWAARGYAVMQGASFPIIGKGNEEPNDTYTEQLVANAKAAIKAVDDMGVVDPKRCAAMGHSYGAFMTANLLAHSDLFAAGIARSGAYNRTLTPFGFQSEERTYWQAKEVYDKMSPFNYADKIKTPLLLIHGELDNNTGTFPINSERLFAAVKGLGGVARLVFLPYESHGYSAKENILHMLWEMDSWLEKYVKNRK